MNKTQKLISALAVIIIAGGIVWFITHDFTKNKLTNEVRDINAMCPFDAGALGILNKVSYDIKDNQVLYSWIANESFIDISVLKDDDELLKDDLVASFQDLSTRKLLKDIVKAGASLRLVYHTSIGDDSLSVVYDHAQLEQISNSPLLDKLQMSLIQVRNFVAATNKRCPMGLSKGVNLLSMSIDEDNLVYTVEFTGGRKAFDEFANLKNCQKFVKYDIKEQQKHDPAMRQILKDLETLGYGITYIYIADDGAKKMPVVVTPQEVHNISMLR